MHLYTGMPGVTRNKSQEGGYTPVLGQVSTRPAKRVSWAQQYIKNGQFCKPSPGPGFTFHIEVAFCCILEERISRDRG